MRVFPQIAVNFATFQKAKNSVFKDIGDEKLRNFLGALSGVVSMTSLYPLETIRTRLSLQMNKSHYKGPINAIMRK